MKKSAKPHYAGGIDRGQKRADIDSIRLAKSITKCTTEVYKHSDMDDLVAKLAANRSAKRRLIRTDGVFSMDGYIAKLPDIPEIARAHDAVVIMDDSHATGVLGTNVRRNAEHHAVLGELDVIIPFQGEILVRDVDDDRVLLREPRLHGSDAHAIRENGLCLARRVRPSWSAALNFSMSLCRQS
ncbi:MAG: aminotransferase class I/II-fold pyridoxal phosphate-dependent enzyme [Gemmatimonadaceae bacterium]|nr:aminotransferase class I/II-fold pyridoxal phosphate-dependent enzyme [Gemmatimonadaceae bacterium]